MLFGRQDTALQLSPISLIAALGAAVYSGFLFAQARGREFWQGLTPTVDLAFQAPAYGAASLILIGGGSGIGFPVLGSVLCASLALHLLVVLGETVFLPAHSHHMLAVKRLILHGHHTAVFYGVVLIMGGLVPLLLALLAMSSMPTVGYAAAVLTLIGLYAWDHIWVHAGQEVPLS